MRTAEELIYGLDTMLSTAPVRDPQTYTFITTHAIKEKLSRDEYCGFTISASSLCPDNEIILMPIQQFKELVKMVTT